MMQRGRAVSMATAQAQKACPSRRTAIGGRRLRLLALPDDVIAQRRRGARPARGHEGGSAPPSLLGGRGRASPSPLPSPPPLPLPSPGPPRAVGGAWRSAPPPGAWPAPQDRPPAAAAGAAAAAAPPGPARPLGGAGPPTPPRGAGPPQSHAPRGAGQRPAPPPGGEKGRGRTGATPTAGVGGGGAAPPPRGAGAAPPPPRGGGRSSPERAGWGRGRGRGGASPGLPLPPPRPSPSPLPGPNPDQQRHRRGRGRAGATPAALRPRPRPFLLIDHAPSAESPAPRPAQPPPEGGARDLRAEHPGRVPAGLREPHPRQRRRGGREARGHFPAGVQHPPEEGLGAAAAAVLPAAAGERAPARLPRQLQAPRAHHGRPADALRPQLAQRPGDEHVRGPGHGRRARQGAFLQLLLLRQTAHARLRGRAALDQERGHLWEGAAADPHPPGGALVPGGRGRGPQDHHLLRLPAHPQPTLPQAHLPLPAGRGRQEGAAGLQGGLERSLQNERRPAEQRQRLRRLRAPVLQVPGAGAPVQLHAAGHAPPAPPDVQGALPLPARPLSPQTPNPGAPNLPKTGKIKKNPEEMRNPGGKWSKMGFLGGKMGIFWEENGNLWGDFGGILEVWEPQISQEMGKSKKTRRKCENPVENGQKMEKKGNFGGRKSVFGGKSEDFGASGTPWMVKNGKI